VCATGLVFITLHRWFSYRESNVIVAIYIYKINSLKRKSKFLVKDSYIDILDNSLQIHTYIFVKSINFQEQNCLSSVCKLILEVTLWKSRD